MIIQFPKKIKPKKSYWVLPRIAFLIEATDEKDLEQQVSKFLDKFEESAPIVWKEPIIVPED